MEGLRTLVFAQKVMNEKEVDDFMELYNNAMGQMNKREMHIQNALNHLEQNMDFIGVSGVEDKLQDNV